MGKGNVLVVDDEEKILSLLRLYLIEHEYTVLTADNGKTALAAVERETPDIIVLDILMPDMNGFEVCERLRDVPRYRDIPVIYLSSLQESESIITGLEAGGDDYLTKPFDPNVLVARINAILRRTKGQDSAENQHQHTIDEYEELTFQEMKILQWIEKGYTNKEIAVKLKLTEGTVKVYNHIIYQKLHVKNRTQAIVRAKEVNIL